MFSLAMPWWEFVVRAALVYGALMVMVRFSGKRTLGQFTPFDLLVIMLLSESVSNGLAGEDNSVGGGLLLAFTLIVLNMGVAMASSRSTRVERFLEGSPVLVGRDGTIFYDILKRQHIGLGDLEKSLRENDCELADMKCAFLETDGSISIMKKR